MRTVETCSQGAVKAKGISLRLPDGNRPEDGVYSILSLVRIMLFLIIMEFGEHTQSGLPMVR